LRTYFADKQIHISADVAHGIWQYYLLSGDESLLLDGGAEVILECARFFYSYAYFKAEKGRFELLDVTGPDEYHERVHNNAFSSGMALQTVETALQVADVLRKKHPKAFAKLVAKLDFADDLANLKDMQESLYVPEPDAKTGVIEQFDGYHKLEEVGIKDLKKRLLDPREYLGGGQGIATSTKVIKQADVMMMLNVLGHRYSNAVKKANWEFYEPRTEHGSSLSPCVYALVAAAIGKTEWAYRYFLKTATVDLTGDAKQYVGSLYIGGTHPAANGGAWMAAVLGFGGLSSDGASLILNPGLPKAWKSLSFRATLRGQAASITITPKGVSVHADAANTQALKLKVKGKNLSLNPDQKAR
jgi:nigerose phosphorylase